MSELPIPSCSAEALLAERDATVRAAEAIAQVVASAPSSFPRIYTDTRGNRVGFDVGDIIREADAHAWHRLLIESGLWSFMDATAREQWTAQLQPARYGTPDPLPTFTLQAAEDLVRDIHANRGRMVARGVSEVFRRLSADYKTNGPMAFGPRIIIKGLGTCWGSGKWLHINHDVAHKLDDLGRFLCLARGLPEPDHRTGGAFSMLSRAADVAPTVVEMDWWTIRLFKNGNGHLMFRHAEDVARLNRLLALEGQDRIPDSQRRR